MARGTGDGIAGNGGLAGDWRSPFSLREALARQALPPQRASLAPVPGDFIACQKPRVVIINN